MQHQLDLTQGRLRVHERGHGPVLVFLHGLLVDHELWEEVVDRLAPAHRCVALDLWSREDRIFPVCHAHRLAADLPDSRVELVDDGRAFVPLDQPARCVELIEAFVSQRARAQATGAGSA